MDRGARGPGAVGHGARIQMSKKKIHFGPGAVGEGARNPGAMVHGASAREAWRLYNPLTSLILSSFSHLLLAFIL